MAQTVNEPITVAAEQGSASGRRVLNSAVHMTETLSIVAEQPAGVTAKHLSRRLGQSLSTTYYALQTLTDVGFIEPSPSTTGLYTLGPRIADLYRGYVANRTLPERLSPVLADLREATRARSYLASWSRGDLEVTHALGRRGATELQDVSSGFRGAAHALAPGKVLLAATRRTVWPEYLQQSPFVTFTPNTVDTPGRLHAELQRVREHGYALDIEEFRERVGCVSAPIRDSAGRVVAAIAISIPIRRLERETDELVRGVRFAAHKASDMFVCLDPLSALLRATSGR